MNRLSLILLLRATTGAFQTSIPPLLDVPVFSLSTLGDRDDESPSSAATVANVAGTSAIGGGDGNSDSGVNSGSSSRRSTMNILTYASPVSIKPHRMWCVSLYRGTMSHENFARERRGVLQLLRPEHATRHREGGVEGGLIRVLGGSSGRDVDKRGICEKLGYAWERLPEGGEDADDGDWPEVLPSCSYYLKLQLVGDLIDCGSHDVALCEVVAMLSSDEVIEGAELDSLSTRGLRRDSIISEFGRIIPPPSSSPPSQ